MKECKYEQKIWGQIIKCEIEDCENCRWNPNLTQQKARDIMDEYTQTLLNTETQD